MSSVVFMNYQAKPASRGKASTIEVSFRVSGLCDEVPFHTLLVSVAPSGISVDADILEAKKVLATRLAQLRAPLIAEIDLDSQPDPDLD